MYIADKDCFNTWDDYISHLLKFRHDIRLLYVEPWEGMDTNGEDKSAYMTTSGTVDSCIKIYRYNVSQYKITNIYVGDTSILDQFIVVHWAVPDPASPFSYKL